MSPSSGKTPEATISAMVYTRGDEFDVVERGRFRLKK
jgi:hypothetical protein